MKKLFILSLFFWVLGQIGSISIQTVRISLLDVVSGLLFLVFIFTHNKRKVYQYSKIFLPFLTVAFISLLLQISHITQLQWLEALLYLVRFGIYTSLIFSVSEISLDVEKIRKMIWMAGVSLAILGLVQYVLYPNLRNLAYLGWDPHEFRIFSTMLDPNYTGILLVLTLILGFFLLRVVKSNREKTFFLLGSSLIVLTLLLTYSRGSFVSLIAVLLVWSIINRKLHIFLSIILLFIVVVLNLPKPGGEGINLFRTSSIKSRFTDNLEALELFQKSPIFGVGFNTIRYTRIMQTGQAEVITSHSGAGFSNSWLFILATTGIVGFCAYCWIWKEVFRLTLFSRLVMYTTLAVFVHSLFDNSLFFGPVMFWLWSVIGSHFVKSKVQGE